MRETTIIVDALKKLLRREKVTYAQIAAHLDLSEASIKRLFTKGGFTLERLEQICSLVKVRVSDLIRLADEQPQAISRLTSEQEQQLVADSKLLLITFLTMNFWNVEQIVTAYHMTQAEVVGKLLVLDRLGMIELLPENKVRRLVARNFSWQPGGAVQLYFENQVRRDFLESPFSEPGEHLRFVGGMLSRESLTRMQQSIDTLVTQMDSFIQQDGDLPLTEKYGTAAVFAIRPWEMPAFKAHRKGSRHIPSWDS